MNRNIDLYPWYVTLFGASAWTPVFFLFFNEHVSLEQVLLLEAIYYASVVIVEVPSGYFSDVVGRRPTLLISTITMSLAYLFFGLGSSFAVFAVAQVLLAVGYGFQSGTDTSFHFDSLAAIGKTDEYGERESVAMRNSFIGRAIAIFIGGVAGLIALRLPYFLSLLTMLGAVTIAWRFSEPQQSAIDDNDADGNDADSNVDDSNVDDSNVDKRAQNPLSQLRLCLGYTRHPVLAWLLGYVVLMTILDHVPYEFFQPYINLVGEGNSSVANLFSGRTPLVAGIIMALSTFLGAWAAGRSIWLRDRLGLTGALTLSTAIQTGLIAAMGLVLHPLVVPLIMLRTVPYAMSEAPLRAAVAPLVPQGQRATYFSMQSLFGRLAFSTTLLALSITVGEAATDWITLSGMLRALTVLGAAGLVGLFVSRRWIGGESLW